jgi:hypothetical protein
MSEGPLHPANETKSVIDTIHRTASGSERTFGAYNFVG